VNTVILTNKTGPASGLTQIESFSNDGVSGGDVKNLKYAGVNYVGIIRLKCKRCNVGIIGLVFL